MATIVVGYDASDGARAALEAAIGVANAFGDQVHVVMAYEVSRMGGEVADFAAALRERAEHVGTLARDQAAGLHFEVTTEVVDDHATDALVDVADRLEARMIVVGSRGESAIKRVLVGSIPSKLIQAAGRPVLIVPA